MTEEYKEVCIHEASHLVFNRLMQKLKIEFPQPKYVTVLEAGQGRIEAGWIVELNTATGYNQLQKLKEKNIECKVAQIMYSLAGFISYQHFVDNGMDKCKLHRISIGNRTPSDISKCNNIAGHISGNSVVKKQYGSWYINDKNLAVLNPIKASVQEIMKNEKVEEAIQLVALKLFDKKGEQIEGEELNDLCLNVDSIIEEVDIQEEINKHC